MTAVLEMRGVDAGYGGLRVLRDVDLTVPPGSIVALLGPNGAGKTTALRVLSGELRPAAGEVCLDGRRIERLAPHRIAGLGLCHVPEGRAVFPRLTVRENLELFAGSLRGDAAESAVEGVVAIFPVLGQRLEQLAGTLSGGEQQMLGLARAFVTRPRLLAVDEISMGLAPRVVGQLFERVREVASAGIAVLLVEQYVREALRLADYVWVLSKGRVVFVGQPDDLDDSSTMAWLGGAS
ncbi:MAG: ABC transporter ATP-binding protein [Acidimicrobiales bacterium]